jgi:clan AA aspartic protease (TIGR02281 family)
MYVTIELWDKKRNKFRDMSILVDTGASVTTISNFILSGIGCTETGRAVLITTASGTEQVYAKTISKIKIGTLELNDVDVYAHDFPEGNFSDGVLGMNVLEQFNFRFNLDDNVIELEKRAVLA